MLDVGSNRFSGPIPYWLRQQLQVLSLRKNRFSGSLLESLCYLTNIQLLDLSENNLSGRIPKCIKNFYAMSQDVSSAITTESVLYYTVTYRENFEGFDIIALLMWKGAEQQFKNNKLMLRSSLRKGHSNIWDLRAAIARGPVLEHMEVDSRKQLWGSFHICHQIKGKDGKVYLSLLELIVDKPPPSAPSEQFYLEFYSFISACLQKDSGNRLSVQELLELPFISMYDDQRVDLSAYFSKAGYPLATL
ncbi:hypothetical protein KIW84_064433 [Lathyrus oleraceus]|uniref:Uncharacterized protein n=1 Tax=Pisum sativum TaxID=3888 RepID=A0A9D4WCM2_PEA|nr:hypothetical protein KIW84_064433 [Pisum sativum]